MSHQEHDRYHLLLTEKAGALPVSNCHTTSLGNPHPTLADCATGLKTSTIWIIGGGPSLDGFPLELLRGEDEVLVVNDGFLSLPWADGVVSVDTRWMTRRQSSLEGWGGHKHFVSDRPQQYLPYPLEPRKDYHLYNMVRDSGLSIEPDTVNVVGTSGYAAVGVAVLQGATHINLLGLDYTQFREHWYPNTLGYASASTQNDYRIWAEAFTSMIPTLERLKIQVVNYGLGSAITAFPKRSLETLKSELYLRRQP